MNTTHDRSREDVVVMQMVGTGWSSLLSVLRCRSRPTRTKEHMIHILHSTHNPLSLVYDNATVTSVGSLDILLSKLKCMFIIVTKQLKHLTNSTLVSYPQIKTILFYTSSRSDWIST